MACSLGREKNKSTLVPASFLRVLEEIRLKITAAKDRVWQEERACQRMFPVSSMFCRMCVLLLFDQESLSKAG